jgi:hypothetical protein
VTGTLQQVIALVVKGEVRVSEHGYDELAADGIRVRDLTAGMRAAELVEDYPDFPKGPCVLVLQRDRDGSPVHVLWACRAARADRRYSSRPTVRIRSGGAMT